MQLICRFITGWVVVLLLTCTAWSSADELPDEIDPANIIEKFDAARDGVGHLTVPVTIPNKKYQFVLDTGCARVLYDSSFRAILGTPKNREKGITDAGKIELERFDSPDASLGKLNLKTTSDVVAYDLSPMREWAGVNVYGVIGMSFLKQHVVRIDFDKGEVLFLKSPGKNPGRAFPLSIQHGVIHTEALIPGRKGKESFLIDTGADTNFSGTMQFETYKCLSNGHATRHYSGTREAMTASGVIKPTVFQLDTFSLGPFTHRNLIFDTSPKCDNKLCLGYLSRYVVTFDFPNRVMYLRKGKFYDLPDDSDRSGIRISRRAGKTVVCNVAWLSPAWWEGIKRQDVILKIDGNDADQISVYSLRRLLGREGKNVKLSLQRGDERIETSLELPSGPSFTIRIR